MLNHANAQPQTDLPTDTLIWYEKWDEFESAIKGLQSIPYHQRIQALYKSCSAFGHDYAMWVTLPNQEDKYVLIVVSPPTEKLALTISVYEDPSFKSCLNTFFYDKGTIYGLSYQANENFSQQNLEMLFEVFQQGLTLQAPSMQVTTQPETPGISKHVPSKPIKTLTQESALEQIPAISLDAFKQKMLALKMLPFEQSIEALRQQMVTTKDQLQKIWVHLDEDKSKSILIATQKTNEFHSNTFAKHAKFPERPEVDDTFDLICFYETNEIAQDNILLQLRISKGGHFGELVYVKAGNLIKGNDLMMLDEILEDGLGIKSEILQDDSKVHGSGKKELTLRIVRPLAHKDKKTWYNKFGFELYPCKDIPDEHFVRSDHKNPDYRFTYTQDVNTYKSSLKHIRRTTIADLLKMRHSQAKEMLKGLFDTYLSKKSMVKKKVSDLLRAIFKKSQSGDVQTRSVATQGLTRFYETFLEWKYVSDKTKETDGVKFQKAVNVLHTYRLFMRKRQFPETVRSNHEDNSLVPTQEKSTSKLK